MEHMTAVWDSREVRLDRCMEMRDVGVACGSWVRDAGEARAQVVLEDI